MTAPPLRRRMACWLYEGILMFGVVFVAGYLFSALTQMRNALDHRHALQGFLFVIFGIYFIWFWSRGHTLAMKTWHIRIVDLRGQPPSQARALLRYRLWAAKSSSRTLIADQQSIYRSPFDASIAGARAAIRVAFGRRCASADAICPTLDGTAIGGSA